MSSASYLKLSLIFLGLALFLDCKPRDPYTSTTISGPVVLDVNEREFVFEKSFEPKKQANKICFAYSDYLSAPSISEPPRFLDGTPLVLTASITDSEGQVYDLSDISNSTMNYLCISPKLTQEWLHISESDKSFIKLRVSSNKKLHVNTIEWVSVNMWDI